MNWIELFCELVRPINGKTATVWTQELNHPETGLSGITSERMCSAVRLIARQKSLDPSSVGNWPGFPELARACRQLEREDRRSSRTAKHTRNTKCLCRGAERIHGWRLMHSSFVPTSLVCPFCRPDLHHHRCEEKKKICSEFCYQRLLSMMFSSGYIRSGAWVDEVPAAYKTDPSSAHLIRNEWNRMRVFCPDIPSPFEHNRVLK